MSAWTIGKKITVGFLAILLLTLSMDLFVLSITNRTSDQLNLVSSAYLPEMELAAGIERELLNARIHFAYFLTVQKEGALQQGWERLRNAGRELPKLQDLVARSPVFAAIRPDVRQLSNDFQSYQAALERVSTMVQRNEHHGPEFAALGQEWGRLGAAMVATAERLSHHGARDAGSLAAGAVAGLRRTSITLALACIGGFLLGVVLAVFVTRDITRTLRNLMQELSAAAQQVTATASQISSSGQSLAQGVTRQAAALQQTSASTEQINGTARQNTEKSKTASDNVEEACGCIDEANKNLEQMVVSMDAINASSEAISRIIKVIDEIAFRTNILALNAAVEAARSGEAGLGFAVVAGEVRNLAQRCAQAAKDTANLIEESIARSDEGKVKLDHVTVAVDSITRSARKAKTLVDEVKAGNQQQTRGIEQIAQGITQIEHVAQSAAAQAEQSAAAASELSTQARAISLVVLRLRALTTGQNDTGTHDQVQLAVAAHDAWKKRLSAAIDSRSSNISVQVAAQDDQCAFGKWLYGPTLPRAVKRSADYKKCREMHARFHRTAAEVLKLALDGNAPAAARAMGPASDFAQISASLTSALTAWDAGSV